MIGNCNLFAIFIKITMLYFEFFIWSAEINSFILVQNFYQTDIHIFQSIDTCLWDNRYPYGEQWIRKADNSIGPPIGPKLDGSGSSTGHYLIVSRGPTNSRADFVSNTSVVNQLKRSYFTCKMTFKYYMSGETLRRNTTLFHIEVGPDHYSTRTVWKTNGQVLNKWTTVSAAIGENV